MKFRSAKDVKLKEYIWALRMEIWESQINGILDSLIL